MTRYLGFDLVNIPSGMGGSLPAVATGHEHEGKVTVICLHPEFFCNWVLTIDAEDIRPWTWGTLTAAQRRIVQDRKPA